jgi:hypothetical protein
MLRSQARFFSSSPDVNEFEWSPGDHCQSQGATDYLTTTLTIGSINHDLPWPGHEDCFLPQFCPKNHKKSGGTVHNATACDNFSEKLLISAC